jgi:hypothetical protein
LPPEVDPVQTAASSIAAVFARESTPRDAQGRFAPQQPSLPVDASAPEPPPTRPGDPVPPPEPEPTPPAEGEPPPEGEAPPAEEPGIESLDDLAKALGVETSLLTATIKLKGPSGEGIPLSSVIEAYERSPQLVQAEGILRQRFADVERREAELSQAAGQRLQELQGAIETMYGQLVQQEESVNWEQLKLEDPVAWTVKRQELLDRQRMLEQGIATRNAEIARRNQEFQQAQNQKARIEHEAVLQKMPQWREPQTARTDMERIVAMLGSYGLDLAQWNHIIDHRMVLVADAAARWWEFQTQAKPLALKRVSTLPAIPKPGPRAEPVNEQKVAYQQLLDRHRSAGTVESAAAVVKNILAGGR